MRFVIWVVAFAAAVVVTVVVEVPVRAAALGAGMCAIAAFASATAHARNARAGTRMRHARYARMAELLVAIGAGGYAGARVVQPQEQAAIFTAAVDDDRADTLAGSVSVTPDAVGAGARFRIALHQLDGMPVQGTIAVSVADGVPDLLPGDAIRFTARLRSVRGLANPGVPDTALQARANGIDAFASVANARAIDRGEAASPARSADRPAAVPGGGAATAFLTWLPRLAARAHRALHAAIDRHAASWAASAAATRFLDTAVLGERAQVGPGVEDGFRAAGATHVLSVSGLHLAAVAVIFFVGLRRILVAVPGLPLWIDPRRIAAVLALPAIAFYTLVSGNAVATVRSALMMAVGLLGVALGRRAAPVVAIAVAVTVLMAWSPLVLFDVSFQLSVVSVLSLALSASRLAPKVAAGAPFARRAVAALARLGAATLAAGLATAPLVAHHFGEITPAAPLGNLLLVPLVEMIVVPFGLAGAGLGALGANVPGGVLLTVATLGARGALAAAERFRIAAPIWLTRAPNAFETALLVAGAVVAVAAIAPRARGSAHPRVGWLVLGGVLLGGGTCSLVARELGRRWTSDLVITFLDVGQGDAAVIQAPGGRTILIDGGGTVDGSFDPGARVVEPFLRSRGITRLDLVILSHPHPDHMGGLPRILGRFPVGEMWTSGDDGHDPRYRALIDQAAARGVRLPRPSLFAEGGLRIEPLGPFVSDGGGGERVGPPEGTTVNDASLVVRAAFGPRSFLFTGDVEADGEGELIGRRALGQTVASDVLKVPHHGSRTSSSAELLDAVRPTLGVISLGWRNRFHFPNPEVVGRYGARGIQLFRTDRDGAVTIRVGRTGDVRTTCARGCPVSPTTSRVPPSR